MTSKPIEKTIMSLLFAAVQIELRRLSLVPAFTQSSGA